ncbi:thiamine pyrophosphate-binding protein [Orrella sp. 11846]|uniref:thiamine pyrophosphate-binding protein n=1 Tax=Orrella sp. 11846 TaxID=3409913 RepID=UPI003B58C840
MQTSSHALMSVLAANGVDRVFLVPGESYLGILDALNEFPQIDVVTCRHESGAGFMACADGRLTRRPGVFMVSRGPGATNAAIAVHTAQQDAVPLIMIVGQVPKSHLRKEAFQEIDYGHMFGRIAKWVVEVTDPAELATATFRAMRVATSGTPGPVVIVVPEDIQQQTVEIPEWTCPEPVATTLTEASHQTLTSQIQNAKKPLIIAGGMMDQPGGREALLAFAEQWQIPVAVAFRQQDLFPNEHPLYVGDLGLANPQNQMDAFHESDLIIALGTLLDDITTQGYTFPNHPWPQQILIHCYPDPDVVGAQFNAQFGIVANPVTIAQNLTPAQAEPANATRTNWIARLKGLYQQYAAWPDFTAQNKSQETKQEGVPFAQVVQALKRLAPSDAIIALDAGTFAAPVYRHFEFQPPQRLMAPLVGAMGYGTPAALASQLRFPDRKIIGMAGDGGFLMTGNEIILACERKLPILMIVSDNQCYASIRIHQLQEYPGRDCLGTGLFNPDFIQVAKGYGLETRRIACESEIEAILKEGLAYEGPMLIEVASLAP